MEQAASFRLPDETQRSDFEAALAKQRTFIHEASTRRQWRFLDTFDWRLYNQNSTVCLASGDISLCTFDGKRALRCQAETGPPTFAWDLPQGALRKKLTPLLKARALLELAQVYVEETSYRVLNADEKTVVRAAFLVVRTTPDESAPAAAHYVSLRPVRGYDRDGRRLAKALGFDSGAESLEKSIYLSALADAGLEPSSYSSKLTLQLQPKQRADEAAKVILRRLFETMRANEQGIIDDIDIEYLHDYRVSIRRTRSALSQIPGVFPAKTAAHHKQTFRTLGKRTNLLRDLDVYLLAEPAYRSMLPEGIREDISPLFEMLHAKRAAALKSVNDGLTDPEYEQIVAEWEVFLNQPGSDNKSAPNAGTPVLTLAKKRINKRYRRIVKDGTYILDHTEDELLHALRLECKKLRYLLEFFASLFPKKKINRLIKQLKGLQENLGDFTDLAVQQEALMAMADELPDDDPRTRRALIATGALVETLARRQKTVKENFAATFTKFAAPDNQAAFTELFGSKTGSKKGKRKGKAK